MRLVMVIKVHYYRPENCFMASWKKFLFCYTKNISQLKKKQKKNTTWQNDIKDE